MKAAHLIKIQARADRVKQMLLPDVIIRAGTETEIADPKKRMRGFLRELTGKISGTYQESQNANVAELERFLDVDIPELIQGVRDANREAMEARRELTAVLAERAGIKYRLVITSDAPIGVEKAVIQPDERVPGYGRRPGDPEPEEEEE